MSPQQIDRALTVAERLVEAAHRYLESRAKPKRTLGTKSFPKKPKPCTPSPTTK